MAVFRVHKNDDFAVISKHHLRNKELSLKAKGLLSIMLSLPDDWDYSILGLKALSRDGRDAVMSAIDELEKHGYLETTTTRNDLGQFETLYDVFDDPGRKIRIGKSESENQPQYNNINKERNNIITPLSPTRGNNKKSAVVDCSFMEPDFVPIMQEWYEYKKEKKQKYTDRGWRQCYAKLLALSNGNPDTAIGLINEAMANNWSGFFEKKNGSQSQSSAIDDIQRRTQESMRVAYEMMQRSAERKSEQQDLFQQ